MSTTISSLFSTLDSDSMHDFASRFGVLDKSVSQGFNAANATMLGALAQKAEDPAWRNQFFKFISNVPSKANASELVSAAIDPSRASFLTTSLMDSGKSFLSLAFGGNQSSIFDTLARSTGLRPGIVSSLMGIVAPLMMTSLGRVVRDDRLNPEELSRLLSHEAEGARELMPSGVSDLFGAATHIPSPTPQPIQSARETTRPLAITTVPERNPRSLAWLWIIPLLLIPFLLYWFYQVRHPRLISHVVTVVRPVVVPSIPGRISLNIPQGNIAAGLLDFIQDPNKTVDQGSWFNFDNLLFDNNSAKLRPGSQEPLGYIASILKAYPNVNLKIGGHTDSTGSALRNLRLSQQRASGVKAALVGMGIAPNRLETQGYGEGSPVADNSTVEGRALNRRISIAVTQK